MTTSVPPDHAWLRESIDLATRNVAAGGGPFGAVIVRDGEVIATGTNQVTPTLDPTAHAEVVAIRAACQVIGDFRLIGCVLVSSCEPCPLCLAAAASCRSAA
jgi:tRNA(Arg) A34 adenosine deaminase TadA